MKKCIIIGAGEFNDFRPDFMADYIISADAGYDYLKACRITPDLLIGDFDSISAIPNNIKVIRFPVEKDKSDLELAVDEAIKQGFDCFYIYGALGKRLDHTLASIAVLVSISHRGLKGWLLGNNEVITAVTNSKITLEPRKTGIISVFPAGDKACGVNLTGLKYALDDAVLACNTTHGLSNEFIGTEAVIEVRNGTLIVTIRY